ncbi:hypothetical protein LOAG_10567, partial [Loa loa]
INETFEDEPLSPIYEVFSNVPGTNQQRSSDSPEPHSGSGTIRLYKNVPKWFLNKSPLGRVPAFEMNGVTIYESSVIAEYLDEIFPETAILPRHPLAKANQKILAERMSSLVSTMFKTFHPNNAIVQQNVNKSLHNALRNAQSLLMDDFYGGKTLGFADIMMWPFLERLQLVTVNPYTEFRYFPGINKCIHGPYAKTTRGTSDLIVTKKIANNNI